MSFSSSQPPATPVLSTLSLHDALPIFNSTLMRSADRGSPAGIPSRTATRPRPCDSPAVVKRNVTLHHLHPPDRKSTRLNSSHRCISYAVFCLKKKTPSDTHSVLPQR